MNYRSILITGGTGSFGNAFAARALAEGWTDRLCILSRDEFKQHEMRQRFGGDKRLRWFLGDVRDPKRLALAFRGVDLVVHAAALKQVDALEYNPLEAKQTNVDGAANVIEAAIGAGVAKVVALSTDKACNPINAYGASKLLAEKLFLAANRLGGAAGPGFNVVRYGNVAGSRGSVIPIWQQCIAEGRPCHFTDQRATRFWMRLDQAVELVRWTAGLPGGVLAVPRLPSIRLPNLFGALGGREWTESSLRPGEKLHEAMIGPDEGANFFRQGDYYTSVLGHPPAPADAVGPVTSDGNDWWLSVEELREEVRTL